MRLALLQVRPATFQVCRASLRCCRATLSVRLAMSCPRLPPCRVRLGLLALGGNRRTDGRTHLYIYIETVAGRPCPAVWILPASTLLHASAPPHAWGNVLPMVQLTGDLKI